MKGLTRKWFARLVAIRCSLVPSFLPSFLPSSALRTFPPAAAQAGVLKRPGSSGGVGGGVGLPTMHTAEDVQAIYAEKKQEEEAALEANPL